MWPWSFIACCHSTCRLPIELPADAEPSGATIGPHNSLIVPSDGGTLLFIDLGTHKVREDTSFNDKYKDAYGWFDLEGIAMTNPESTFIYVGMENKAAVLEYEWHSSHKIFRRFMLPDFNNKENRGMESLTWVPTAASHHQGYFYVGSQMDGSVYIYELPLLEQTGPEAMAKLINVWQPLPGNKDISGLSFSDGYIFTNFDDGVSNHVLIFPVLANGLPGKLKEQYQVDVTDAEGMAMRKIDSDTWEVFFTSDSQRSIFAYTFQFVTGFDLHPKCAGLRGSSAGHMLSSWWALSFTILVFAFRLTSVDASDRDS